jgi:hypothetical protein
MTEPDFPYEKPPLENPPQEPLKRKIGIVFSCRICGKFFSTQAELNLHMGTSHKIAQQ